MKIIKADRGANTNTIFYSDGDIFTEGGTITIHSLNGITYLVSIYPDGRSFVEKITQEMLLDEDRDAILNELKKREEKIK